MIRQLMPALTTFFLAFAVLLAGLRAAPQHGDEAIYGLTSSYYGTRIARFDFSPTSGKDALDPGWNPRHIWALTLPMGTVAVYGAVLGATGLPAPVQQWDPAVGPTPETTLAPDSLLALRLAASFCAALGLALAAVRFRWRAVGAAILLLLIPHVRVDLARGWAEGPLFLGLGLCIATFGTRWFGVACGLAATAKLTALGLWPLLLWPRSSGNKRWASTIGLLTASAVWTAISPTSWLAGGPIYLPIMIVVRAANYLDQSSRVGQPYYEGVAGFFLPTRYLLPLELAAALAISCGAAWLWQHQAVRRLARQAA